MHLLATLDDDLFGTRASDKQFKMLGSRKADKEGHSADAVADALFRIVLAIRFRRRGEQQTESVRKLFSILMDGRGEEALNGCIATADRGYEKQKFIEVLSAFGVSSVFVMLNHLLRVHPFVASSYLDPRRADLEYNEDEHTGGSTSDRQSASVGSNAVIEEIALPPSENVENMEVLCDRRRRFIIDDSPKLGPDAFIATKMAAAAGPGNRTGQKK